MRTVITSLALGFVLLAMVGCHPGRRKPPRYRPPVRPHVDRPVDDPPVIVKHHPERKHTLPPALVAVYDKARTLKRPPLLAGKLDASLTRKWRYIVIHHSATDAGSEEAFHRYHRDVKGWDGIGYDFVIGNGNGARDGLVEVTYRWEKQLVGAHAGIKLYNEQGIGICIVGDLEKGHMSAKQLEALVGLINYLQKRCKIPTANIVGHCHIRPNGTKCPGKHFPWFELLPQIEH